VRLSRVNKRETNEGKIEKIENEETTQKLKEVSNTIYFKTILFSVIGTLILFLF
jgi:hypothetical protein